MKVVEEEINGSRFIVATLYAILEDKPLIATEKKDSDKEKTSPTKESSKKGGKKKEGQSTSTDNQDSTKSKLLSQFFGKNSDKLSEPTLMERRAYDKRRTVGATTVPLDPKNFVCKPPKSKHASDVSTGDLWKPLRPIASGISGAEERVSFCSNNCIAVAKTTVTPFLNEAELNTLFANIHANLKSNTVILYTLAIIV